MNKQFADRIEELRKKYEEINEDRKFLRFRPGEARPRVPSGNENFSMMLQESSLRDAAQVYGRETERDEIVGLLTNVLIPGDLPVFSIIGCGGIGKTTIARIIFEHESAKEFFDLRIWVGFSQEFDVVKATRKIIESADKEECCLSSFNLLQYRLKEIVMKKRFLIVLDNVWNEDLDFWEKLRVPMVDNGVDGSRVLVTTQSERVSMNMQASRTFRLQGLPFEHCWTMFSERAFVRREGSKTLEGNPELKRIGMEIVEKCQGLPILVKSIASILCSELHEYDWRCVLDDMPEDGEVSRGIVRTLRVSYDHLPLHLKHCFAFCSIFPVGYEFDKDKLIKLWMALGFIKPSGGRRRVEDIGGKYFTDLLWRSFFHASDSYHNKEKQMYKMPSVIHDLAKSVSKFECAVKDDVQPDKIKMARYIMLHGNLEPVISFQKVLENKCLRALVLHGEGRLLTEQNLCELFKKLKYLRVLDLSNSQVEELPDSIGGLILLRYLNLSSTEITALPETVGNLHNLQTLELGECHQLIELPDSIGNLKHLRHLGLYNTEIERLPESVSSISSLQTLELGKCYNLLELPKDISSLVNLRYLGLHIDWGDRDRETNLISMPSGIGGLTSLQTLSRFIVGSKEECGIGVLKNLNLQGELCISNLENVANLSDAEEAKLRSKSYINSLMLRWSGVACSNSQNGCVEEVIEGLCPHENLKHLWIENYSGDRFPNWMQNPHLLELETLRLANCKNCKSLPFVAMFQHLKILLIEGLDGIESMDHVFSDRSEINGYDMAQFSELTISRCSRLRNLPCLPSRLTKLEITDCQQLNWDNLPQLPELQDLVVGGGSEDTIKWIENLTSLSSLMISQFSISDFTPKGLALLKKLKIQECHTLESLAKNKDLQDLVSLEYLEISSCPKFSSFPKGGLPATLKEFRLSSCESLSSWPSALNCLSSLHLIEIHNVPGLKALTALPEELHCLRIRGCPTLQRRCQEGGDDWSLIRNIPCKTIESVPPSWFMKIVRALTPRTRS